MSLAENIPALTCLEQTINQNTVIESEEKRNHWKITNIAVLAVGIVALVDATIKMKLSGRVSCILGGISLLISHKIHNYLNNYEIRSYPLATLFHKAWKCLEGNGLNAERKEKFEGAFVQSTVPTYGQCSGMKVNKTAADASDSEKVDMLYISFVHRLGGEPVATMITLDPKTSKCYHYLFSSVDNSTGLGDQYVPLRGANVLNSSIPVPIFERVAYNVYIREFQKGSDRPFEMSCVDLNTLIKRDGVYLKEIAGT